MRISDWSSDVCSSDLLARQVRIGSGQFERRGASPDERLAVLLRAHVDRARRDHPARALDRCRFDRALAPRVGDRKHPRRPRASARSEEHTSEPQSLMRIAYAVFCLTTKINQATTLASLETPNHR